MAIVTTSDRHDDVLVETPLVSGETVNGAVDYKGRPVMRSKSGGWRSAWFLIGVEVTERIAYYGIQSNLMIYLTEHLQQSTAMAAKNVNVWNGTASLLPLFGAFIADSYLGRYRTILIASFVYILGLGLLTFSTMLPSQLQLFLLFFSLYMVAIGQGGHKPCTQAFGADQFDENHPKETKQRSSFFNWWTFFICAFGLLTLWTLNYIQDNLSWVLGFGIPCLLMIISLLIFLLGTTTYRFIIIDKKDKKNPFLRIGRVFVVAMRNWGTSLSDIAIQEEETCGTLPHPSPQQFNFLNKAQLAPNCSKKEKACSLNEVEEAKAVLKLAPIWATSLVFGIVYAQVRTFFTKQGVTMDRTLFPGFDIPPASLQSLISLAIVISGPIYDRIFIPIARAITKKPSGITMLQRIGTGMFLSLITIVIAALVEMKRLKTAKECGLVDKPNATIPINVWWLIPQYFLFGIAEFFAVVGLQEFFYDQVPKELRSIGIALYLSIIGVGSFLSSFLIFVIEKLTGKDRHNGWFANNLNHAHLDYFYWLLVGLTVMGFALFILFAKSYIYNRK